MTIAHLVWTISALPKDASALQSAISSLQKAIATLESSSGLWEDLLKWFTGLVVAGLIPEVIVVWWEHRAATKEWKDKMSVPPSKPSSCKFALELVGAIAIFLGVAGEFWAGAEIAYINGQLRSKSAQLRSKSEQLLAFVTEEAGDAAQSSKIAHDEARAVKGIADASKRDARDALVKAKAAQRELAQAQADAGKAQATSSNALALVRAARSRADKIDHHLAKIEKEMAWRDLTPKQQLEIAAGLHKFGSRKYSLLIWGNTPEITRFAEQIIATLKMAGWTPDGWGFPMGGSASGVLVSTEKGSADDVVAAANALVAAFNTKGIFAAKASQYDPHTLPAAMTGPWKGEATIRVIVGAKP